MKTLLIITISLILSASSLVAQSVIGSFQINTIPAGAEIYLCGSDQYLCSTPSPVFPVMYDQYAVTRDGITGREITIAIIRDGYHPLVEDIFVPLGFYSQDLAIQNPIVYNFRLERDLVSSYLTYYRLQRYYANSNSYSQQVYYYPAPQTYYPPTPLIIVGTPVPQHDNCTGPGHGQGHGHNPPEPPGGGNYGGHGGGNNGGHGGGNGGGNGGHGGGGHGNNDNPPPPPGGGNGGGNGGGHGGNGNGGNGNGGSTPPSGPQLTVNPQPPTPPVVVDDDENAKPRTKDKKNDRK